MFTGLTRQEQRALILLLAIGVGGVAYHQLQGDAPADALVIDAETGRIIAEPTEADWQTPGELTPEAERIDLNTASMTELMTLPGIGETRARTIIIDREQNGPFRSVDEITRISGIGEGTLARLRGLTTVSGVPTPEAAPQTPPAGAPAARAAGGLVMPAPALEQQPPPQPAAPVGRVNVNTADRETLMTLPGIGEVLADRIIQHRTQHGPFRTVEDLTAVPRIGERTAERLRPLVTF